MKYKLSFGEIEQLSKNIFEVTINAGANVDEKCTEEAEIFWHDLCAEEAGILWDDLRTEPYKILVNLKWMILKP